MAFTRQQVLEMQQKLASLGYKDTDFEILAVEDIGGEEWVAVVDSGVNKRMLLGNFESYIITKNIPDIDEIRQNAAQGATAYHMPNGGIPRAHLSGDVQGSLGKADRAVQPSTLQNALKDKQDKLTFDDYPTPGSDNPVKSGGIAQAIDEIDKLESISVNGTPVAKDANNNVDITVPTQLSQLTEDTDHRLVSDAEKDFWDNKYDFPDGGIPASDLAPGVMPDLSRFITKWVNDLVYYYKKSEVYNKQEVNNLVSGFHPFVPMRAEELPEASADTMYKICLVPSQNPQTLNSYDEYITIDAGEGAEPRYSWELIGNTSISVDGYVTQDDLDAALVTKQDAIDAQHKLDYSLLDNAPDVPKSLSINFYPEAGTGVVIGETKAEAAAALGITTEQLDALMAGEYDQLIFGLDMLIGYKMLQLAGFGVSYVCIYADAASVGEISFSAEGGVYAYDYMPLGYAKPAGGIPATDLASAVQTSLGKADTAVQPADMETALADKQDVLVAGTNIEIIEGLAVELPAGYKAVEYLQSSGTQYINTDVALNVGNIGFEVDFLTNNPFAASGSNFGAVFGGRLTSGNNDFQMTTYGASGGTVRYGEPTTYNPNIVRGLRMQASLINNELKTSTTASATEIPTYTFTSTYTIYLFGLNNGGSFTQSGGGCRIYRAKFYSGSTVIADMIPAQRLSDSAFGMYDVVRNRFLEKSGTGNFLAGPFISSQTTINFVNNSGFITIEDVPEGSLPSSTTPLMDGTAAVGTETAFARGDHRHPSDTSKQNVIGDLETIRSGAALGATALQSFTEADPIFSASAAAGISSSDITNWDAKQDALIVEVGGMERNNVSGGGSITITGIRGQFPTITKAGTYKVSTKMQSSTQSYGLSITFGSNSYTLNATNGVIEDERELTFAASAAWSGAVVGSVGANTYINISVVGQGAITTLSNVAVSGSYNDLSNLPSIPAAQIQSDWNQTTTTAKDYIKNKPSIPDALADLTDDDTHRLVTDNEKTTWNGKQAALVSGTNIKTINSQSLLGSGNITVGGVMERKTTIPSGGMLPNVYYDLGTVTSYTFTINRTGLDSTIVNHWIWAFRSSASTDSSIVWPTGLSWDGGSAPTINRGKRYEISVIDYYAEFNEMDISSAE